MADKIQHNLMIGDILYVLPINNAIRYGEKPFEVKVKSFGKKFVNLERADGDIFNVKVDKNTLQIISFDTSDYVIFATEKERQDYIERPKNLRIVVENLYKLSNDDLKSIINLINSK